MISFAKELQYKRSSFVCFTADRDASSVVVDNLFAQTQADTGTFGLGGKERYKDFVQYLGQYTATIVCYRQLEELFILLIMSGYADFGVTPSFASFGGVFQ